MRLPTVKFMGRHPAGSLDQLLPWNWIT